MAPDKNQNKYINFLWCLVRPKAPMIKACETMDPCYEIEIGNFWCPEVRFDVYVSHSSSKGRDSYHSTLHNSLEHHIFLGLLPSHVFVDLPCLSFYSASLILVSALRFRWTFRALSSSRILASSLGFCWASRYFLCSSFCLASAYFRASLPHHHQCSGNPILPSWPDLHVLLLGPLYRNTV